MNYSGKIESLLNILCSEVYEAIANNSELSRRYVNELGSLSRIRELFNSAANEKGAVLQLTLHAAAMSDVFFIIVEAMCADDEADDDELNAASEMIAKSLHRYCWLAEYKTYSNTKSGAELRSLLTHWLEDTFWLGGYLGKGAISRPFNDFVLLACFVTRSPRIYRIYSECILIIAKHIIEVDGVNVKEQNFYDQFASTLKAIEVTLQGARPVGHKASEETSTITNDLFGSVAAQTPAETLREILKDLSALVGVDAVKLEIGRLTNFLKFRQQRLDQGMQVPT